MSLQCLTPTRPDISSIAIPVPKPGRPAAPPPSVPRRGIALTLIASGGVVFALAAVGLATLGAQDPPGALPVAAPSPQGLTIAGAEAVSVVTQVYAPGQESGWHSHPGIHAVAILSGALTVYDETCGSQTFTPGRPYVGGQQLHLTRNETAEPVEMAVTYLTPAVPADSTRHPGAPACWGGSNG